MKKYLLLLFITVCGRINCSEREQQYQKVTTLSNQLSNINARPDWKKTKAPLSLQNLCIPFFSNNEHLHNGKMNLPLDLQYELETHACAQSLLNTMLRLFPGDGSSLVNSWPPQQPPYYYQALCRAILAGAKPKSLTEVLMVMDEISMPDNGDFPEKSACYDAINTMLNSTYRKPLMCLSRSLRKKTPQIKPRCLIS